MNDTPFYITTPIYYVNDKPHIGHAYTSVACDAMARYKRLTGHQVKFLTGTDEHGQKVEKSAAAAGLAPQAFADMNAKHFQELATLMNISNDDFIRTTEPRHARAAQALWRKMQENGHIYLGGYAGWYALRDEAFYAESELVDGKAPTGAAVEWVEEPSYFFDLSRWQQPLLDWYAANPDCIAPAARRNEVMSFVKGGLRDLSISRTSFSWGIPVPGDEKHIMYVWLDALANYLSALGYPDETIEYKAFWPASLHMVGKDILRFHAVYWPAFLMAAGLPLPKRMFAHGWWTIEGEKMSKSLGNTITAQALTKEFGVDQTRWFLLREVPFGSDGNFSRGQMIARINSELANTIGNLAQRSLSMIHKHCDGKVPDNSALNGEFKVLLTDETPYRRFCDAMNIQAFHVAGQIIMDLAIFYNGFIDNYAPWKLKTEDPALMHAILYVLIESIRKIAIYLQVFTPESSSKLLDLLHVPGEERSFHYLPFEHALKPGTLLPAPIPAFPRYQEAK